MAELKIFIYSPRPVEELKVMAETQVRRNGISKRCRQSGVLRAPSGDWKWIAGRCRRDQSKCEWGNRKLKADLLTVQRRVDVVHHSLSRKAWCLQANPYFKVVFKVSLWSFSSLQTNEHLWINLRDSLYWTCFLVSVSLAKIRCSGPQ